jgi:hypothetical protein
MPTRRNRVWVWAALLLFSCAGPDDPNLGDDIRNVTNVRYGVDYSWARPSPSSLRSAGYTFVVRYLSYDTTGKNLTRSEANALIAAGLDIVSNWEQNATDALSGYSRGVSDAQAANQQAAANGAPANRPIYFSVDFDATSGQQAAINAYFDGVASVIGRNRTGAYGGYYVIQRLFDANKITWGWQTYAWSGGQWDARAQLRQIQNGILGGQADKDEAVAIDFGQWGHTPDFQGESLGTSGQSYPVVSAGAVTVHVGETVSGWVKLRNSGVRAWQPNVVWLAPIPRDTASPFVSPSWHSPTRISTVAQAVNPGEIGTFQLDLTGHTVGESILSLGWVAENITWFDEAPMGGGPADGYFAVKVNVVAAVAPDGGTTTPDAGGGPMPGGSGGSGGGNGAGNSSSMEGGCAVAGGNHSAVGLSLMLLGLMVQKTYEVLRRSRAARNRRVLRRSRES